MRNQVNTDSALEARVSATATLPFDYEQSGKIPKSKVLADLRGDWKRYRDTKFQVSQFEKVGADNYRFIVDYQLFQGDRARSGKLEMTDVLSTPDGGQISALKAKVVSAK